jgi:hypothetical protein
MHKDALQINETLNYSSLYLDSVLDCHITRIFYRRWSLHAFVLIAVLLWNCGGHKDCSKSFCTVENQIFTYIYLQKVLEIVSSNL